MKEKTNIVCFAMGKKGVLSRIFSPLFGAYFTYASVNQGLETASGQLDIQRLRKIYSLLGV
jgi:3-dehydroquinate dehydratase